MRTEEFQQDQEGMISTALAEVYEPGDQPHVIQHDAVLVDFKIFQGLMKEAGYTHAEPTG